MEEVLRCVTEVKVHKVSVEILSLCHSSPADVQFLASFPVLAAIPVLSHGNTLAVLQPALNNNADRITLTVSSNIYIM